MEKLQEKIDQRYNLVKELEALQEKFVSEQKREAND